MKVTIEVNGDLVVEPENDMDHFALRKWYEEEESRIKIRFEEVDIDGLTTSFEDTVSLDFGDSEDE